MITGVSDIWEKERKFYFVVVNSNTPSDQAESSTSCYRVTTLYIHALHTTNLHLVSIRQCPILGVSDIGSVRYWECPIKLATSTKEGHHIKWWTASQEAHSKRAQLTPGLSVGVLCLFRSMFIYMFVSLCHARGVH